MLEGLSTFPCAETKRPLTANGYLDARVQELKPWWPLVGVATGAVNGFDLLDIDPRNGGERWLVENVSRVPVTRVHDTRSGGCHYFFKHQPGLRKGKLAPGVDVLADGAYAIWWPREGLRTQDAPIAEWPVGLIAPAYREGAHVSILGELDGLGERLGKGRDLDVLLVEQGSREWRFASKALNNAMNELMGAKLGDGRNNLLNALAYSMGRLVARGWVGLTRVIRALMHGCQYNGLLRDDGPEQCMATIMSGVRAGLKCPYPDLAPPARAQTSPQNQNMGTLLSAVTGSALND